MAELEELEQETLDEQLLEVGGPATDQLPSVPQAEPARPAQPAKGTLHTLHSGYILNKKLPLT